MEKQLNLKEKRRLHRLIQQGGLIDMVGFNTIDKPLLAGLLIDCKNRLDFMTDQQKYELRNLGYLTMQERKGKKYLEKAKTRIKPFEFWKNPGVQTW
jgi:Conjugal transfer protein TraD